MGPKDVLEELVTVTLSETNCGSADSFNIGIEGDANSKESTENSNLFLPIVDMLKQQEMEDAVKSIFQEENTPNQESVFTSDLTTTSATIIEQASLDDLTANDEDDTSLYEQLNVSQNQEEFETLKEIPEKESSLHGEEKNENSENSLKNTSPCDDSDDKNGWDKRKRNTSETEEKRAEKKSKTRDVGEEVNPFFLQSDSFKIS